ncbi:TRAP transporter substrate-binding protein DctP (plasmid) [Rhodococcus ruber]|uniref:TRAP transporter substrate-binding protein DctP n=1 Tax=Rhodococcus ruber TaxID=1830 RepID=UPI00265914C6|nr:TRAP transporter substrate-binding protein DctP [Rhodococcus ruber]WKK14858.1 TRAP transporter substrate-binding protein DctP [Rhodococcus ruber]
MRPNKLLSLVAAAPLALLTACAGGATTGGSPASGEGVQLTVSSFVTEGHPLALAFDEWMEEVTNRTDGAVTFETFYNGSLCSGPDSIACAEDRTADIVLATPAYSPDMTLANISSVGFQTSDLQANQDALNKLYEDFPDARAEYEDRDLTLLYSLNSATALLASIDRVDSLEDIEGMSLRAAGAMTDGIAELGAQPVATDPAEIYEALGRGTIDGALFGVEHIVDYRLPEVAPYYYDIGEFAGSYAVVNYVMNLSAFESLGDEYQSVVREVSGEIAGDYVEEYLIPATEDGCRELEEAGVTVEQIGPESVGEAWRQSAGDKQRQAWESNAAQLTDATAMFDAYAAYIEEFSSGEASSVAEICAGS